MKLPLRIDRRGVVDAADDVVFDAEGRGHLTGDEWQVLVSRVSAPSLDQTLGAGDEETMEGLDRIRPRWWIEWADRADLEEMAASTVPGVLRKDLEGDVRRNVVRIRQRALRRLRDATWLLGRAVLEMGDSNR